MMTLNITNQLPQNIVANNEAWASVQIHDHLRFSNIARVVDIMAPRPNLIKQMFLEYQIRYFDTNDNNTEVFDFNSHGPEWLIDNSKNSTVRDSNYEPVPNPNYDVTLPESEENHPYVRMPAYDFVKQTMMWAEGPLTKVIEYYILEEALPIEGTSKSRFDF